MSLLTDPMLRRRLFHLRRHGAVPPRPGRVDAVLLSHIHYDHLDLPSLRMLRPRPKVICPAGAGRLLRRAGCSDLEEVLPGDALELGRLRVTATPAEHSGRRNPHGPEVRPLGFVIDGERSVYFAGDTDLFDGMAELAPVDVALLPVAGYSPKLGPGHLDAERAARAACLVKAWLAIPIHWGTLHAFTRSIGPWFTDPPAEFAARVSELAADVEVRVLAPGESVEL